MTDSYLLHINLYVTEGKLIKAGKICFHNAGMKFGEMIYCIIKEKCESHLNVSL